MTEQPEPHQSHVFTPSGDGSAESEQEYQKRIKSEYAALFTADDIARIGAAIEAKRRALRAAG